MFSIAHKIFYCPVHNKQETDTMDVITHNNQQPISSKDASETM